MKHLVCFQFRTTANKSATEIQRASLYVDISFLGKDLVMEWRNDMVDAYLASSETARPYCKMIVPFNIATGNEWEFQCLYMDPCQCLEWSVAFTLAILMVVWWYLIV